MGSACCVAVKDRKAPPPPSGSTTTGRNSACSPQWSFRRDNRRRVADEIDTSPYYSGSREISMDKMSLGSERGSLPVSRKPSTPEVGANPIPLPSSLLPPKSTPSRRARRSPGHQLFRQVSDSQILGLKSPISEERASFNAAGSSHYASSEGGWSINTFSELVAYSQRQRLSFDSDSGRRKLSGSSSRFSFSPCLVVDQQTCVACSKLLTERSSIATSELPIAAVLVCGHVYHAECLETMTTEKEKFDPACPICTIGEKQVAIITRRALKAEAESKAKHYKRCKNRVVDSYGESERSDEIKMEPSCSSKGESTKKSFLKSISSQWSKPLLSKDSALKRGFWSRRSSSSIEELNQTSRL